MDGAANSGGASTPAQGTTTTAAPTATPAPAGGGDDGGAELAAALEGGGGEGSTPSLADVLDVDSLGDLGTKRVRMKINGQEETLTLLEALKRSQRFSAATAKEMRAAEAVRAKDAELSRFFEDPDAFLSKASPEHVERMMKHALSKDDPKIQAALERAMKAALEESQMAPEDRERRRKETDLERREREIKEREERIRQDAVEREAASYRAQYEQSFKKALEAGGMRVDARNIAAVAQVVSLGLERGVDVSPEEAVQVLAEERKAGAVHVLGSLEGDGLLEFLGNDIVRKVNQATVARLKRAQPQQSTPRGSREATEQAASPTQRAPSTEEVRAKLGLRRTGW